MFDQSVANKGMEKYTFTQWRKLAQTFWKELWNYLFKFKMCIPFDPEVLYF